MGLDPSARLNMTGNFDLPEDFFARIDRENFHAAAGGIITTTLDSAINWARKSSIWPMSFGLACCAIEMMAAGASRFDLSRFGAEVFRPFTGGADQPQRVVECAGLEALNGP